MRTTIALICLTTPSLYLLLKYLHEYGLTIGKISGRWFWSLFALVLLVAHVFTTVSGRLADILAADLFPFRGFLFFMVSGFAYGAAIFPQLLIEKNGPLERSLGSNYVWIVAIPAWLWISVLIILAAVNLAS